MKSSICQIISISIFGLYACRMAEADCVTRLNAKQLLQAAKFSQTRARGRRAGFRDSFLVTSCGTSPVSLEFPNEVQPLSVRDSEVAVSQLQKAANCNTDGGRSCVAARQVFAAQTTSSVTFSSLPFSTSHSLPGNVPVVDHLYGRNQPGASCCQPSSLFVITGSPSILATLK
jgi:hypothetical protein